MKKIFVFVCIALCAFSLQGFAADSKLLEVRNKIFDESKELRVLLTGSQDVILISSLWDSCLMTITQLDAYFSMLGIVNTIRAEDTSDQALTYLVSWLNEIMRSTDLNIKSLNTIMQSLEPRTKLKIAILKNYFADLNSQVSVELNKLSLLKKTLTPKKRK